MLDYDTVVVLRLALVHHGGVRGRRARGPGRAVHLGRAAARHVPGAVRLARRPGAGPRGGRARRAARDLDHRDRRPVPAAALRDRQPVDLPRPRPGQALGHGQQHRRRPATPRTSCGRAGPWARPSRRATGRCCCSRPGRMSHTFWPLRELRAHEASDPAHIRTAAAREADQSGSPGSGRGSRPGARHHAGLPAVRPEAKFAHYLMMAAALGGRAVTARAGRSATTRTRSAPAQMHLWFDRPAAGWTGQRRLDDGVPQDPARRRGGAGPAGRRRPGRRGRAPGPGGGRGAPAAGHANQDHRGAPQPPQPGGRVPGQAARRRRRTSRSRSRRWSPTAARWSGRPAAGT